MFLKKKAFYNEKYRKRTFFLVNDQNKKRKHPTLFNEKHRKRTSYMVKEIKKEFKASNVVSVIKKENITQC